MTVRPCRRSTNLVSALVLMTVVVIVVLDVPKDHIHHIPGTSKPAMIVHADPGHEAHPKRCREERGVCGQVGGIDAQCGFHHQIDEFEIGRGHDHGGDVFVVLFVEAFAGINWSGRRPRSGSKGHLLHVRTDVAGDVPGPDPSIVDDQRPDKLPCDLGPAAGIPGMDRVPERNPQQVKRRGQGELNE